MAEGQLHVVFGAGQSAAPLPRTWPAWVFPSGGVPARAAVLSRR